MNTYMILLLALSLLVLFYVVFSIKSIPTKGENGTPTPTPTKGENGTPTPTPTKGENGTPTPTPTKGENGTPTPTPTKGSKKEYEECLNNSECLSNVCTGFGPLYCYPENTQKCNIDSDCGDELAFCYNGFCIVIS